MARIRVVVHSSGTTRQVTTAVGVVPHEAVVNVYVPETMLRGKDDIKIELGACIAQLFKNTKRAKHLS